MNDESDIDSSYRPKNKVNLINNQRYEDTEDGMNLSTGRISDDKSDKE